MRNSTKAQFSPVFTALFAVILTVIGSCGKTDKTPSDNLLPLNPAYKVSVVRLDSALAPGLSDVGPLLSDQAVRDGIIRLAKIIGADTENPGEFAISYANSQANTTFAADAYRCKTQLADLSENLGQIRQRFATLMPSVKFPDTVYTVISPYRQSVFSVDSAMYVAINHFYGSDYAGYESFPASERVLRNPDRMALTVAEALLRTNDPYNPTMPTALADMIHEGAIMTVLKRLSPEMPDSLLLGLSSADFEWLEKNRKEVWRQMIGANMLFTTDAAVARRLIESPQPITLPSSTLPPHTGRYIGYRLVNSINDSIPGTPVLLSTGFATNPTFLNRTNL